MSEWKNVLLTDVSVKIGDGLHGTPTYDESGDYHFINGNNLLNGKIFIKPDTKKINKTEFDKIKKDLKSSTILLSINGTIGNVSKYTYEKCALGKSVCYINLDENIILRDYFYYECLSYNFQSYLDNIATGTTIPNVPLKGLRSYEFRIPPLTEQEAIASVLCSLDDKVDLLHRQNKTLQSMSETLFRQWFIEEAQDDWVEGTLGSIASNVRENITNKNISSEAMYVGLEHIDRRNIALLKNGNGCDVDSNKSKFLTGDILFGKLRPYFHKVCTAPFDGICSTDILVIRPKKHNLQCFSLFAFFQNEVIEFANIASGGTRMPRIDWASLANYPISLPPDDKLNDFEKIVSSQVRKINFNINKIKILEKLRDTLLPKLMSGEVQVQYAEEAIASVA